MTACENQTPQRARNGVEADARVVRQKCDGQNRLARLTRERFADISQMQIKRQVFWLAQKFRDDREQRRQHDDGQNQNSPRAGIFWKQQSAEQQQKNQRKRNEAATQIVKN